jgi:uncharacterized membrane protein YgcG
MEDKQPIITKYKKLTNQFLKDNPYQKDANGTIYSTKNRRDYETKKLEKQQTKFLGNQWQKVKTNIQEKSLLYETQRYPAYMDYDLMEYYPIIGQALDIFMEECTTINAEGKILNIFSESSRVKEELEELFYNRLNVHTVLPMWIRNMCKYGDNFVYLQVDDELGVVGAKQLTNIEVERIEGGIGARARSLMKNDEDETIFRWRSTDVSEFKYWQIAHFRLLVDDKRLPYGVSVLEKARRIWKNLLLVEDAMRTIRLLRAIDRRVYYIDVGNIDPNDVQAYVEDIASRFKRKRHIDEYTGQEDLKYNVMGYDQDYFIPRRDANDGTKIDTLAGSSNVDAIADIEYDLNQLFAALGIPKPFLQYDAAAGEGKNLAMQDVRLARKVNRIQQAALQELNKIAMVHLTLLGLDDELHNFELSMNNPSMQSEIMRTEQTAAKITLLKDSTADLGKGIAPMSVTMAMKEIMGWTDDQIRLNLEQQFMETVAAEEIKAAPTKVSTSTLFDGLLKLYGIQTTGGQPVTQNPAEGGEGGGGGGGGFSGGGSLGGFDSGGGGMGASTDTDLGLDVGAEGAAPVEGAVEGAPEGAPAEGAPAEGAPAEEPAATPAATEEPAAPIAESKQWQNISSDINDIKLMRITEIINNTK